ncbi:MAG: hypothetical protein L6E13_13125 [Firmicutes bacterium]|nr:hypothetical protein [Bacillota bacterium]
MRMRMRMASPYTGWMMATLGLLGLTYGLGHTLDEDRNYGGMAVTALAAPLALAGLAGWTMALVREARR